MILLYLDYSTYLFHIFPAKRICGLRYNININIKNFISYFSVKHTTQCSVFVVVQNNYKIMSSINLRKILGKAQKTSKLCHTVSKLQYYYKKIPIEKSKFY
ncbi:unnamed protein product [Caenorhabditis angaria]|uniref:Uncharacterized protein n=1 Tax=Caenorhabditis angaria TaxID=860376 RepID=A0A9P1IPM9_9PELO|nr:unnamed protein product [Caenorhabditis angaria]